ncbi:MAG: pyridoxal-phosphate dependent enzyme [Gemmatimonadetes bacterium]|nr:pyridoxal-phosphate dependent enzyme [Gemmatimonadota bacterium]
MGEARDAAAWRGLQVSRRHVSLAAFGRRPRAGVIAPSSGNHAQAVAYAARLFGVPATVVMPTTVTAAKRGGAERLGAGSNWPGRRHGIEMDRALELVANEGLTLVPPYDDATIIAGQGTSGLVAEDLPQLTTVLVPVGGGGLSAGVSAAISTRSDRPRGGGRAVRCSEVDEGARRG